MHASFMQRTQGYGWRFFPRKTNESWEKLGNNVSHIACCRPKFAWRYSIVERCNEMNTQRQPIGQAFDLAVGRILKTP